MASVYSVSIAHGTLTGSTLGVVYTVPAGQVLVVRCVTFMCYSGGPGSAGVTYPDGSRLVEADVAGFSGAFGPVDLRHVLDAGDTLSVFTTAGDWTYAISGYLLDA